MIRTTRLAWIRGGLLSVFATLGLLATMAHAADNARPSWICLPEETWAMVRAPSAPAFVDALRKQTKLGKVLLSDERLQKMVAFAQEQGKERWEEAEKALAKFDLKLSDWTKLFQGEMGFAVVAVPRPDQAPRMIGLTWIEPGQELADRLLNALKTGIESQQSDEHPIRRVDLDIVGQKVIHLAIPEVQSEFVPFEVGLDGDNDNLTEEQIQQKFDEYQKKVEAAPRMVVGQTNLLITRVGERLLMANSMPEMQTANSFGDDAPKNAKVDWDAVSGLEETKGAFARFLKAHAGGESTGFAKIMSTPGLTAALPDGVPLLEAVVDVSKLLKMLQTGPDAAEAKVFESLGIDKLGPVAVRLALDKNLLRTGLFASVPSPRNGLLTILDQTPVPSEPPAWVSSSVMSYAHLAFDLGAFYSKLKSQLSQDPQTGVVFGLAEQQVQAALKADVATLLSAFGTQHMSVDLPPLAAAAPSELPSATGLLMGQLNARTAIVWQVKDQAVIKRLLDLAGAAAQAYGLVPAEEQGFSGLRMKQEGLEGGIFLGKGYLVLGVGPQVAETVMAMLRNPPTGKDALRTGDLLERARKLLAAVPGINYSISDASQDAVDAKQAIISLLDSLNSLTAQLGPELGDQAGLDASEAAAKAATQQIKDLFPGDDELEGVMGVSTTQVLVNQHGLVTQSILELPAP